MTVAPASPAPAGAPRGAPGGAAGTPGRATGTLPPWRSVLAVVAHPDDESFGLGAVLDAFARAGATVTVLCLTRGEASTVHGVSGDLATLRRAELAAAADLLGLARAELRSHPDGRLAGLHPRLVAEVRSLVSETRPDGLLVFDLDGVTAHPDHAAASAAAVAAAEAARLPVLAWTLPRDVAETLDDELGTAFTGCAPEDIDLVVPVDRERQRLAALAHASQAVPTSVLWRRLELLGDVEHLRWLRRPPMLTVDHRGGDRFAVAVRGHELLVDQPVEAGGDDEAPTPTELFVGSLASCVAFYARRYLRRHRLPEEGLAVEVDWRLGTRPARVSAVDLRIVLPEGVPAERREPLLAVASHCTVHTSITTPPDIAVRLAD